MAEIIDKNSGLGRQLGQLFELAKQIRAPFLEQAIYIEGLVEDIISRHFCPDEDRFNLFFSLIINRTDLTFSSKIDILERLIRLRYADLLDKYPKLIDELTKLRKFRNRIAHAILDSSDAFLAKKFTDRIQLIYYEDGQTKQQIVTVAENKERLRACSRLVQTLVDIQKEVVNRVSANK